MEAAGARVAATPAVEEFNLQLGSGRLHGQRFGAAQAPLALCVHGLAANMHAFDYLAERLAGPTRQVVAIDLRGRGRSQLSAPGTYGLQAHARDVLEVATALGQDRFDLIGWSMGALIGQELANTAAERIRRLVLIDAANRMDDAAVALVRGALQRLDAVVTAPQQYLQAIRQAGVITPWNPYWDRTYAYELVPDQGALRPSTSKAACLEDLDMRQHDFSRLWPNLTMPVLLVRCTIPVGGGLTVPDDQLAAMRRAVGHLQVVEVDRNHFGVMTLKRTAIAIREFLA